MRPKNLKTRIFLDSGDPQETRDTLQLLGFLDGQTTNPTLVSKNPQARARFEKGDKFTKDEIFQFYHQIVTEISRLIPNGSVSIEVYADSRTTAKELLTEGGAMFTWIPNAHIKYPTTTEGLTAAERSIKNGMRVNMTLVFSQEQAAAVYAATQGAKKGDVFLSPFVGRLDDIGQNGMDLIKNCIQMYKQGDDHVEVLTASVRNMNHFLSALALESDIITAPFKILKEWAEGGLQVPGSDYMYDVGSLNAIPFAELNLRKSWKTFDIKHDLTDKGIEMFSDDWNALVK